MKKDLRVVICGNYGASNLGDEAILDGILALLQEVAPHARVTVMSAQPDETIQLHHFGDADQAGQANQAGQAAHNSQNQIKAVSFLPSGFRSFGKAITQGGLVQTVQALQQADAFILGGGGLFTDEKAMAIVIWSLQASFALLLRKPMMCLGQSVGPLSTFFGKTMTRRIFQRARAITVRDESSAVVLEKLGIENVQNVADPAFCLSLDDIGASPPGRLREKYVVFSVRSWMRKDERQCLMLAEMVDWLYEEKGLQSVMVPFQAVHDPDQNILEKISKLVKHREAVKIYEYTADYREVLQLISGAYAVIGMRLHSLIFSTLTQTPFLALSYSQKVASFVRSLEQDPYLFFWENFKLENLKQRFHELEHEWEKLHLHLGEKNLQLRDRASKNADILRNFLESCG